jgi:hypothetical protein
MLEQVAEDWGVAEEKRLAGSNQEAESRGVGDVKEEL